MRLESKRRRATRGLVDAMRDADFVQIDETLFETEYVRVPDEDMVPEDIVMELRHGDDEVELTAGDFDGVVAVGGGVFRLRSGELIRFLSTPTIH